MKQRLPSRNGSFRIRRSRYVLFRAKDQLSLELIDLLRGKCKEKRYTQLIAASCLTGKEVHIDDRNLEALLDIPSETWMTSDQVERESSARVKQLRWLARKGLAVTTIDCEPFSSLRKREDLLCESQWHIYSAIYHFMSRWENVFPESRHQSKGRRNREEFILQENELAAFMNKYGPAPPAFLKVPHGRKRVGLPHPRGSCEFFDLLKKRKTTRSFERTWVLSMQDLSTLLYYVYGCHGLIEVCRGLVGVRKTSPSGGGLHPIEVYLLVMRVNGVTPGLYHYNVQDHALDLIEPLLLTEAQNLANEFTCGQVYPRWANALFIMSSRFFRSYWKYRNHPKAYAVLLMDAAHLSQTFYLMCAQLGLGAFVTAAVNSKNIEDKLHLSGFENGVLAVCGCGKPRKKPSTLEPMFKPYTPQFHST